MNIGELNSPPEPVLEHRAVTVYRLGSRYEDEDESRVLDLVARRYERAYSVPNAPSDGLERYVAKARVVDASLRHDSTAWLAAVPDGTVVGHARCVRKTESNVLPIEEEFGLTLDSTLCVAEWGRFISEHHPDVSRHGVSLPIIQAVVSDAIEGGIRYMVASLTEPSYDILHRLGIRHTQFTNSKYRRVWYQATWTLPAYWRVPEEINLLGS